MLYLTRNRIVKFMQLLLLAASIFYIVYHNILAKYSHLYEIKYINNNLTTDDDADVNVESKMKYILLWTGGEDSPSSYLGSGRSIFIAKKCKWNNCFVTSNPNHLQSYTEFDVILFNGPRLWEMAVMNTIPKARSLHQKYVYANVEAAANYPITSNIWNGFFNWTWTYRLDSDSLWGYVAIRNASKHIIGPSKHMNWMELSEMKPIDNHTKQKLKSKSKAAAWFSSNCDTKSAREHLVMQTQTELRKYGLDVDIYGSCGTQVCTRDKMDQCLKALEKKYYFYFAFENALCEDYVTEKILYALQHNTVPVVYGGANYSRFMPDGIYLDALKLGPKRLAREISDIMRYPDHRYYDFFRWKNHYSYHFRGESPDTDDYCNFCALLNNNNRIKRTTTYDKLDVWWKSNLSFVNFREYENLHIVSS